MPKSPIISHSYPLVRHGFQQDFYEFIEQSTHDDCEHVVEKTQINGFKSM